MFLRPSLLAHARAHAHAHAHATVRAAQAQALASSLASRAVTQRIRLPLHLRNLARLASSLHPNAQSPALELHPHTPPLPLPLHHAHLSLPFLLRDDHSAPPAPGSGSGAPPANRNGNGNDDGDGKPPHDGDADGSDLPPTPPSGSGKRSPLASPTGRSKAVVFRVNPRRQPGSSSSSDSASADSADAQSSPPSSSSRSSASGRLPPSNNGDDPDDLADSTGPTGQLQTLSPPESYSPVMILPITRRPLFPGFYKTVVIKDPDVIAAIKELARTQQPYVTAVLLKDEEADQDRVSDLDEIYRMGVFCQITNVYHSAMPAAAAVAAGGGAGAGAGGDDGPSLTAILYPHRRVRVKGLVTSKDKVPRAVVEEEPQVVDAATKLAADVLTGPISDASAAAEPTESTTATATTAEPAPTASTATAATTTPAEDPNEETSPQAYLPSKFNVSMAKTEPVADEPYKKGNQLIRALTSEIVSVFKDIATLNPLFREQIAAFSVSQASATIFDDPSKLADFAAAVSGGSDAEELQGVLDSLVIEERLQKALYVLKKELVNAQLQSKISKEVETKIQKRQREYYLMEQLKGIKKELGLESDGKDKLIDKFKDRLEKAQIPAAVKTVIDEEMAKLGHLDPASSEFNVTRNYLDWLTCLPWGKHSSEELDVAKARVILDEDHYGLKDVKDRILEFIAVGKLKGTVEGKIICMVGPPGVGKTSIGKSIARALNREFYRFSVGGLSDVAEIKGHRRTYVGAMPGKMVQALKKVQTENPLVLIDEIDKLGKGMQGDPASALLELLDPEQNNAFLDHYLDVPLDLSKVLFVCTANVLETIPAPLLDRMEVIQLSGYVADEKAAIAERYLAPQAKHACGLAPDEGKKAAESSAPLAQSRDAERETVTGSDSAATAGDSSATASSSPSDSATDASSATATIAASAAATPVPEVQLTREAIDVLIRYYCRESGVRNLKKHIEKIYRKAAFRIVADGASEVTITPDNLKDYVGNPPFQAERLFDQPPAGVVMGLAWTAMGGSALYIESVLEAGLSRDAKPMFKTTGQLGDVMKESTALALTYAKTFLAERFKDLAFFEHAQIHLHVPEGAQPKDGPSAGITMTTALISLATRTPVPGDIAMTGELTLTGKVLKIGGLKEKTISAKRSGVKTILFPKANAADWAELPDYIKEGLTGVPVEHYSDVFEACFGEAVKTGEFAKDAWRPGPKEEKKTKSEE